MTCTCSAPPTVSDRCSSASAIGSARPGCACTTCAPTRRSARRCGTAGARGRRRAARRPGAKSRTCAAIAARGVERDDRRAEIAAVPTGPAADVGAHAGRDARRERVERRRARPAPVRDPVVDLRLVDVDGRAIHRSGRMADVELPGQIRIVDDVPARVRPARRRADPDVARTVGR